MSICEFYRRGRCEIDGILCPFRGNNRNCAEVQPYYGTA
jgi:hypothetical protein